jgi:putative phosphoesterase
VRIGVVSDTHDRTPNVERIVALFRAAGVKRVVHTGDITKARTLDVFARLERPLAGVWGNNDLERDSLEAACGAHDFDFAKSGRELVWAERRILVVHDPREIRAGLDGHDLVLHGHDHRRRYERERGVLVLNPGECAGFLAGHNAVAVVELATLEVEFLRF